MLESYIEKVFREGVKRRGGKAIKLAPTIAGLPDRMVLMPGGRVLFVELKRPSGEVSEIQKVRHAEFLQLGHPVELLWSVEEVRAWVASL